MGADSHAAEKMVEALTTTPARVLINQALEMLEEKYHQKRGEKLKSAGSEEKLAKDPEFCHLKAMDNDWLPRVASPDTFPRHSEKYRDLVTSKGTESFDFREMMVFRMLVVGKMEPELAADRLLNLRGLVLRNNLSFVLDEDIRAGINLNVFSCYPPKLEGAREGREPRVCFFMLPRNIDYKKVTVHQMQKYWFFSMMVSLCSSFSAQTEGLVVQNSLKDIGPSNVAIAFQKFVGSAGINCMPSRVSRVFLANEPFFITHIIFPLLKNMMSKKIRERVSVVGTNYKLVHEEMGHKIGSIHAEMNGGYSFNDPDSLRRSVKFAEEMHLVNYEQNRGQIVCPSE